MRILKKATHINELERNGKVTVHLDAGQSGVGTATCGPATLPPYLIPIDRQQFDFYHLSCQMSANLFELLLIARGIELTINRIYI